MDLGETIATYDVDLALRGESGKFEITSPGGEIYYVTCKPDSVKAKPGSRPLRTPPQAFLIKKVAERVSVHQSVIPPMTPAKPGMSQVAAAPFLLEDVVGTEKPVSEGSDIRAQELRPEIWDLELSYSENDGRTEHPSAFVFVQNTQAEDQGDRNRELITVRCVNFNELDSEIRRLHAKLDEICLRAKKKFYKARAAVSA